jgi:sugar phosphate isomerase/epimerase
MVLSCTTRTFPDLPLERSLARITWAGFQSVELWMPPATPLPEPASLQELLAAEAVTVAAVEAGTLGGEDVSTALEAAAHVGRCAVLAQGLSSNRVVCDLAIQSEPMAREVIDWLLEALSPVSVLLCLRNRPEDGPEARERLLSLIGSHADRVGLALDPGIAQWAGWDLRAEWDRLFPVLRHLYVTDALGSDAVAPGTGEVEWEELASLLRADGYSGAASLWLAGPGAFRDPVFAEAELKDYRFLMENWFHGAV